MLRGVQSPDQVGPSSVRIVVPAIALLASLYFMLFAYFLWQTAIASPISDMFTYIDDYLQFRAGTISLIAYLWRAHGEHHLLWVRLLTWADVSIFHTRGIPFMVAASVAISASAALIWWQLRQAEPKLGAGTNLGLFAPMVLLTTANVTDCSVPINTTYPITVFFAILALVLFTGAQEQKTCVHFRRIGAMLAVVGASMGTATGMLGWPILLWLAWRERLHHAWLAILAGVGIVYILFYAQGLYFLGLVPALKEGAASFVSATHLLKLSHYFVAFLGLPFSREPTFGLMASALGGVLFLAGTLAVLIATFSNRLGTRMDRIAIGMILLALGSAALATVGRSDLIEEVKLPVRYTIFASALQIGLLCIVLPRAVQHFEIPHARILKCSIGLMFAVVLLVMQVFIGHVAMQIAKGISRDADCFAQVATAGPVNQVVTHWPDEAKRVLAALRRQGLLAPRSFECAVAAHR